MSIQRFKVTEQKYQDFLLHIYDHFSTNKLLIHDARNKIKKIFYEQEELVVKSFKRPNWLNKLVYTFFKDSKAKKSYDNSIKIGSFAPKAIGYIEFYDFGLLHESYFVSEAFEYDFTIREPLLDPNFTHRESIFQAFAAFTFELHEKDILHLDYSPGNILIKQENNGYIFKIVDINRMRFIPLSTEQRLQNFAQLWAKNDDLRLIVTEYASLTKIDIEQACKKALYFSQKHKDKKNFKKRLKGKKVVD